MAIVHNGLHYAAIVHAIRPSKCSSFDSSLETVTVLSQAVSVECGGKQVLRRTDTNLLPGYLRLCLISRWHYLIAQQPYVCTLYFRLLCYVSILSLRAVQTLRKAV